MNTHVSRLSTALDEQEAKIKGWEDRYLGNSPLTFLSPESKAALGNRLSALSVNYCRLAVDAISERLKVTGWQINGSADAALWDSWREQGGEDYASQAITDALMSGKGWLSVWALDGAPVVRAEPPTACVIERDALTGRPVRGLKRWRDGGKAHAVFYELARLHILVSNAHVPDHAGVIPADGWSVTETLPNPLNAIPLVPLVNRGRTSDVNGVSEMEAIADLNDALTKVLTDALVTSEAYARPRRYATGLELKYDEDGNPVDPFPNPASKLWTSESEETKFGQFQQADLNGYTALTDNLLSQISALSGLPGHYVFVEQTPSNGEEVRAREVSLVARCEQKIQTFSRPLAEVAALMVAIRDNASPAKVKADPVWSDPASRTIAQEADAVSKLASGDRPILPMRQARQRLGYSNSEIAEMERAEAVDAALRTVTRDRSAA